MKIVIDIPEDEYKRIKEGKWEGNPLADYIENGTPLPKNHGRLIDVDWILNKMVNANADVLPRTPNEHYAWNFAQSLLTQAPIIIEADKEE